MKSFIAFAMCSCGASALSLKQKVKTMFKLSDSTLATKWGNQNTYPADPPGDVSWPFQSWAPARVEDIEHQFNQARRRDPTISVDLDIEYTQDQWSALSDNQKGLYLSNKERIDRGIAPYAVVAREVSNVAEDYANYLRDVERSLAHQTSRGKWTGSGRSASACCGPWERIDAAVGQNKDFFSFSENLAWASTGQESWFPEPVAVSVYNWIYDDSGSAWGHRHFSLAALTDNAGESGREGLAGFGVSRGQGGTYTVMNVADEGSSWQYSPSSTIVSWSDMEGGRSPSSSGNSSGSRNNSRGSDNSRDSSRSGRGRGNNDRSSRGRNNNNSNSNDSAPAATNDSSSPSDDGSVPCPCPKALRKGKKHHRCHCRCHRVKKNRVQNGN